MQMATIMETFSCIEQLYCLTGYTGGLYAGTDCVDSDNNTFPDAAPNDGAGCLTDTTVMTILKRIRRNGCDDSSNTGLQQPKQIGSIKTAIKQWRSCYDDSDGDSWWNCHRIC